MKNQFHKIFHMAQKEYKNKHWKRAEILRVILKVFYQCDIPLAADIADTVWFCHSGFGVVINPKTVIRGGNKCSARSNNRCA